MKFDMRRPRNGLVPFLLLGTHPFAQKDFTFSSERTMYLTRLHRRQATIALFGLAFTAAGCAHDSVVGPGAPQSAPASASFSSATVANGAIPSVDERGAGEAIARNVAIALADPLLRLEVKLAFASSGNKEGKLDFTSYLAGRGATLLAGIAAKAGDSPEGFAGRIGRVRRLEFYMPVAGHREAWTGGDNVLVGIALGQAQTPVAFDIHGKRIVLDRDKAPTQPTIMLDQVETDFRKQIPVNLAGRALVPCTAVTTPGGTSLSVAMSQCSEGTGAPGLKPRASFASQPDETGFFASFFRVLDAHEPWFMGDPELEIHATAKQTRYDLAAHDLQCIGAEAATSDNQPGIKSWDYYYDQAGNFWDGRVLILSPMQLDLAMQSEPNGFNLAIWEDDDEACKIKQKSTSDYFKQAVSAASNVLAGRVALTKGNVAMAWGLFGSALKDVFSLFRGDDDYVGLLVYKWGTQFEDQIPPENNYAIIDDGGHLAGRATMDMENGPPTNNVVTSVLVSPNQPDYLPPGSSVAMEARGYDASGRIANVSSISWSSSNPGVASVSSNGLVSTLAEGTSTITGTVNGISASTTATVYGAVSYVQVTPSSTQIYAGNGVFLQAQPYDSHGTPVPNRSISWFSQDPNVAGVDQTGMVTGYADGNAIIQANVDAAVGYAWVTVGSPPPCGPVQCNVMVNPGSSIGPTTARPRAPGRASTRPPKRVQARGK